MEEEYNKRLLILEEAVHKLEVKLEKAMTAIEELSRLFTIWRRQTTPIKTL